MPYPERGHFFQQNEIARCMINRVIWNQQYQIKWVGCDAAYANNLLNDWTVNITSNLISVPKTLLDNTQTLEESVSHTKELKVQYNSSDLRKLNNCLRNASRNIAKSTGLAEALLSKMNQFNDEMLAQILGSLKTLAEQLMADSNTDQKKIKEMQKDIDNLRTEIIKYADIIGGGALLDTTTVIFGICLLLTFDPFTIAEGLTVAISLFILGSFAIIKVSVNLYKTVEELNARTNLLKMQESDALQLSNCSSNYQRFSETTADLKGNVSMVIKAWDSVATHLNTLADELEKENVSQEKWTELLQALQITLDECAAFEKGLKVINISDMQTTTANITYEMDEAEVKASMEQAKPYPIDEYMLAM